MHTINKKALAAAVALACSLPVHAQNENQLDTDNKIAKEPQSGLEIISVTATKRKTKLMETPVAITALTEAELKRMVLIILKILRTLFLALISQQQQINQHLLFQCAGYAQPTLQNLVTQQLVCI